MTDTPSPVRRLALVAIVVGTVGIALSYATAFGNARVAAWGQQLMAVALPLTMIAFMTLGAVRHGASLGKLAVPFTFILVLVIGGFLVALLLPADKAGDALWLGLPRRAAIVLYGIGIFPLFVLPLAYAWTFDRFTLTDDDIARVRAARLPGQKPSAGKEHG